MFFNECLLGGVLDKLVELALELEELLKAQQRFRLPLSHLISAYQKWFNRKSPFDPVNYGFLSVKDLLEALPTVVKVRCVFKVVGFDIVTLYLYLQD